MDNEAQSMTGVRPFGQAGGALHSDNRGALDATATRRLNMVRNVAENLVKPLLRKWMSYNGEFLDEEQVVRITNDQFVEIRRDDLEGNIDIDIEVSTAEDNTAKAQELGFLMQTMGQSMDAGMRNLIMSEIARLHKMPDLAKQIKEYQPQPDPYVEQMKQLEMAKLQAEIGERQSRAQENGVDMEVKSAKADLDRAKARATHSNADMTDLGFLEKESGVDKQHELLKQDNDRLAKMDMEAMRGMTQQSLAKSRPLKMGGKK